MKLEQILKLLQGQRLTNCFDYKKEITMIKASDLMSDVLTSCKPGSLLITGLVNTQSVRTAEIVELAAVMYVRGKKPSQETIKLADSRNVSLLCTEYSMFKVCGILYSNGLKE
ncbi:MAG: transcriptional regulator [bacterium]